MGFFITEEKEVPEFSNQDANKVLKVDSSGVYLQWLQETTTPAELPSQAGNQGSFLTTNGSVPSWAVVNQVPGPTGPGQILNSTGAGTYEFNNNPTIDIIRTGSGSSSGLRIGASNTGIYGLSSTNVMGIITGNVTRQTWDSAGSTISVPLTCTNTVTLNNGLALTFSSQASNRTLTQTDNTFQRMNFSNNDVTFTLPVLNNGTMFYFNPFANTGSTFGAYLQGGTGGTGGVQNLETYYNGVRTLISNAGQTGNPSTPAIVKLETGSIYQCIYFATLGNWLIIRLGITQQVNFTGGSATVPSISFNDPPGVTGNNPSGLYGSNDQVNVCTNGVERLRVTDTGATITGNLVMAGSTGGIGVVASTADAAGLYSTTNTTTGIRFQNTNNNLRILCNTQNIIDCTRNSSNNEGLASMEEVLQIKKCVRTPFQEVNADFTMATLTPQFLRVDIANGNQVINLGVMPVRCEGQYHTILPFKSSVNGNRLYITTAGSTAAEIHYYENRVKTVITGNTQFEIFEGVVYQCIYKSTSPSTGIWYFWPDCNSASQGVVTVTGIQFGGAGSYITGTSAGQSSTMSMQLNTVTAMSTTQDDYSIFNTLKLSKAPTSDFFIVDFNNYAITRDSPKTIILTRLPEGSGGTQITFPNPNTVPNGLQIEVIVWNLPDKNGSGYKRIRFTEVSAFVIGATQFNMMAVHSTNYEVAEGTWFTANCIRTSNNVVGQTVNRWFLRARAWVVPSGADNILTILNNADT